MKQLIKSILQTAAPLLPPLPMAAAEKLRLEYHPRFRNSETRLLGKNIRTPDTFSTLFAIRDLFDKQIYRFESEQPQPYILDCGANIGLSVLYFKSLFSKAKIIAFEPDPVIFDYLTYNVKKAFDWQDVELINKGVWKENTTLYFEAEGADGGRLTNSLEGGQQVEVNRLRDYLDRPIDFLKIDIEGAEMTVLEDCQDVLQQVRLLYVEYHSFVHQPQQLARLLAILAESGFRYHIHQDGYFSPNPFVHVHINGDMDLQLGIYAFRV